MGHRGSSGSSGSSAGAWRLLAGALVLLAAGAVAAAVVLVPADRNAGPGPADAPGVGSPRIPVADPADPADPAGGAVVRIEAAETIRAWDRRRAAAYAAGDLRALGRLYRGKAGAGDRAVLAGYVDRGLRVRRLRMQLLSVTVLAAGPRRLRVRVTDRLAGGFVVRPGEGVRPATRYPLPRDRASTRVLLLRRRSGPWRVARVGEESAGCAAPVRRGSGQQRAGC